MRRKKRLYGEIDLLQVRVQEGHKLRFSAKFPKLVAYNSLELKFRQVRKEQVKHVRMHETRGRANRGERQTFKPRVCACT